jgi:preprotein translocase subunit SecG
MIVLLTILIAIISTFLIIIVLVQNPKGGGLNSAFGGAQSANQIIGAANSTDILEKITWALASGLLVLSLTAGIFFKSSSSSGAIEMNTDVPAQQQQAPQGMPQGVPQGQPQQAPQGGNK